MPYATRRRSVTKGPSNELTRSTVFWLALLT